MSSPWTWQLPSTVRRGHGCLGGCRRLALGTPQLKRCKQCTEAASSVSKWTGQLGHGCTHHEASSKGVSHRRSSSYCTWPASWPRCADVWNKATWTWPTGTAQRLADCDRQPGCPTHRTVRPSDAPTLRRRCPHRCAEQGSPRSGNLSSHQGRAPPWGKFNRGKTRHLVTSVDAFSQRWYEVSAAGELEAAGECPKATMLSKQTNDGTWAQQ